MVLLLSGLVLFLFNQASVAANPLGYPRFMAMNIGKKDYDNLTYQKELAKADVVILGFYPGWERYKSVNAPATAVTNIKKLKPTILVGQYTILNEAPDPENMSSAHRDLGRKVENENWWLRDASGKKAQWTDKYAKWDINLTDTSHPDAKGLNYPEWLVKRDYAAYFQKNTQLDIWYLDNTLSKPAVKSADYDGDGDNEKNIDPDVSKAYRMANVSEWNAIRSIKPNAILIGNSDDVSNAEYQNQLNGVFMEALIGKSWSTETAYGWERVMKRYRDSMQYTLEPRLVGFNVWGAINDYQVMRYGLTSCLLDNGYFSYTDYAKPYQTVPWFDEFDIKLGQPIDQPSTMAWQSGVYRREFENGFVFVNPTKSPVTVSLTNNLYRISGKQAPTINSGKAVGKTFTLQSRDGIILLKSPHVVTTSKTSKASKTVK